MINDKEIYCKITEKHLPLQVKQHSFSFIIYHLSFNLTFASSLFLNAEAQREKEYKKISVTLR